MLGTILFVDEATGTAIIRADDGKRYRFPAADWPAGSALAAGVRVDFDVDGDRALGPLPISDAVVEAVTAAPVMAEPAPREPMPDNPAPVEPAADITPPVQLGKPVSIKKSAAPATAAAPAFAADPAPAPATPAPIAAQPEDAAGPTRPLSFDSDEVPDYVDQSEPRGKGGGISGILVVGGAVLLLVLAALAYMMWDNAESAGFAEGAAEDSGESVSLFAQEDLPVRNVASMTNATVLGRIARGDRVTGVEVPGSADTNSRWLRIDGGNRFVPMTGLGPSAPPALPAAPVVPPPVVPPTLPGDGDFERTFGGQGGDYRADQNGPVDAVPPNRPTPPPVVPSQPPRRPPPVRPSPPPERQIQPSRPQDTRPVGPQRPDAPRRQQGDPRETQPVG